MRDLLAGHGDVRYVWRHLPLNDVHPHAQIAAEAAEAAADQGAFWEMHGLLITALTAAVRAAKAAAATARRNRTSRTA
jgi:protein-disulfide isomerase